MATNETGFGIEVEVARLSTDNISKQIQEQLNRIKGLSVNADNITLSNTAISNLKNALKTNGIALNLDLGNTNNIQKRAQNLGRDIGQQINDAINRRLNVRFNDTHIQNFANSLRGIGVDESAINASIKELQNLNVEIRQIEATFKGAEKVFSGFKVSAKDGINSLSITGNVNKKTGEIDTSTKIITNLSEEQKAFRDTETEAEKLHSILTKIEKAKGTLTSSQIRFGDLEGVENIKQSLTELETLINSFDKTAPLQGQEMHWVQIDNAVKALNANIGVYNKQTSSDKSIVSTDTAVENLTLLKSKWEEQGVLTDELRGKVKDLETELNGVATKGDLTNFKKNLQSVSSEVEKARQELNSLNNFKLNVLPQVQDNAASGFYADQVQQQIEKYNRLGLELPNVQAKINALQAAEQNLNTVMNDGSATVEQQKAAFDQFNAALKNTNAATSLANSMYMSQDAVDGLIIKLQNFLHTNTAMTPKAKMQIQGLITSLQNADVVTKSMGNNAVTTWRTVEAEMRAAGKLGDSWLMTLKKGMQSFSYWTSATYIVMTTVRTMRKAITTVQELDTALVDLRKTTDATSGQLEDFYYSSNDVAKQLGVTTQEVIQAAAAWSRLGYSIKDAQTMSENSAIMASISPGMNIDTATDGLVSVMKAFKIEADDTLDGIISKINIIGNTQAVSNEDIVNILTRSSSAMAEANNTLEETIALGTAATEITRNADQVGTALKTVSMRIRGYDEETESYSEDLANLSGEIADLTKTASAPGGISLFSDAAKTEYKSTRQILQDISEIYDELTDKQQAQLLEKLAGKRQGQIVGAIIGNFNAVTKSMNSMANSEGNAMREMEVIYDSLDYKINRLKESGTGIAQNLFQRDEMKMVIDLLTTFANAVDFLTDKLGLLGTIGLGAGIFAGFKNFGRRRQMSPPLTKYAENYMCFIRILSFSYNQQ